MRDDKRVLFPVHDLEAYHDNRGHVNLVNRAVPLLPEGVRIEDRMTSWILE